MFGLGKPTMIAPESALPGRDSRPLPVSAKNAVLGSPLEGPWPEGSLVIYLGAGCYWGVEEIFWQTPGVINTSVGFMGGFTPHPTYEETCTGRTGHTETALVVYNSEIISTVEILKIFWENHDPTQGFGQGNDVGTLLGHMKPCSLREDSIQSRLKLRHQANSLTTSHKIRTSSTYTKSPMVTDATRILVSHSQI
jgi:methionine-S-sulfoxide reductase